MTPPSIEAIAVAGERPYPVQVGPGAWQLLPMASGRIAVVVDENVWRLHGQRLRETLAPHRAQFRVIPSGEQHKTLTTASDLYDWLAGLRLERGERVLAVGGGVTGDLAGFVAATWRRGVPLVQLPTTLLAMVDSSVGGKVAVDLPQGKNLVGAFHPPSLVLADTDTLTTLPPRERWCGLAEAVKTALLTGGELFSLLDASLEMIAAAETTSDEPLRRMLALCIAAKAAVVARDPYEYGERAVLNLGHTLGHALESAGGYQQLMHGEAVSWGLRAALRLSGLSEAHPAARLAARLPRPSLKGMDVAAVRTALASDKKSAGGTPLFVLLDDVGRPRHGCTVQTAAIERELERLMAEGGAA